MKSLLAPIAVVALGCALVGCQPQAEVYEAPPPTKFAGKPDPRFAGTWKTADGRSTYTIEPDGKYRLQGKVSTQGGSFDIDLRGRWALDGDLLYFEDDKGAVAKYRYKLEGATLRLNTTGTMKRETVLTKK